MWFYPILLILVLLGVAGAVFMGGVYTLVLVPLVVIVILSALGYAMRARSRALATGATAPADGTDHRPLPHRRERMPSRAPTRPESLVEGRRQQQ